MIDVRQLPPALLSRSITIRMEPKRAGEPVESYIAPDAGPRAEELRECCRAWAERHVDELKGRRPDLIGLTNRRAEVWWPLLVLGEAAGGEWEDRARAAARAFGAGGDETDRPADQVQLLMDVHAAFGDTTAIFTVDLLAKLNNLEERPWGDRRRGEGLDARGLATLLRPFKIRPRTVRIGEETAKGYHVDQFADTFGRYLPEPPLSVTSVTSVTTAPQSQADVTDVTDVTATEAARRLRPTEIRGRQPSMKAARRRWVSTTPGTAEVGDQLLTAREVADLLGVSAETVLRWTRRGELPAIRLPSGAIRFREAEIEAWLAERATTARGVVDPPACRRPRRNLVPCYPPRRRGAEMPRDPTWPGLPAWPEPLGPPLLRRRRQAPPQVPVPVQVRRARPLPRRDRAAATRRGRAAARADARRVRRRLPGAPRGHGPAADDRRAALAARLRHRRRSGTCRSRDLERMSGEIAAWRATLPDAPATAITQALRQALDAAVRWGYMSRNPAEAGRTQPASPAAPGAGLHRRRDRRDRRRAVADVPAAARVRRRDRPAARGVAGARAPRRRPPGGRADRPPHRLERRDRRAGQDDPQPPPGAAVAPRARRARRAPAAARHAAACSRPRTAGCSTSTTSAAASGRPAIEASGVRDARRGSTTCAPRSPRDALAAGVSRVRAGARDGHERRDDRAPLRRRCSTAPVRAIAGRLDVLDADQRPGRASEDG